MESDIARVVISADRLEHRVGELAERIAGRRRTSGEPLVIVGVLSGALVFVADLIRRLPITIKLGHISVSSYMGATQTSGALRFRSRLESEVSLSGRDVLIVDDILDSGKTLAAVQRLVGEAAPASVETAVLLRKTDRAPRDARVDHVGFDIADEFVVGYGMDYDGRYRNLPYIAVLKPECYAERGEADCDAAGSER